MGISPVIIASLIGAAVTGTTTGLEASGAIGGPSGPNPADIQRQQNLQNQKTLQQQEQEAFKRFSPDVQGQTGGALSDSSFASMVAELSGAPADMNLAQQTLFGNTPGLSTGSPGGQ
jgi:hypothetical protein